MDHATNLFVTADDWVELAAAGLLRQIAGVALEGLVLGFGVLVGYFLRPTDDGQSFEDGVVGCAMTLENLLGRVLEVRGCEQKVLGGDVFVFEIRGLFERLVEQLVGGIRDGGLGRFSGNFWKLLEFAIEIAKHGLRADADLFQDRGNDSRLVFHQGREQVDRHQLWIAVLRRKFARALDRLLRFYGEFVPTYCHTLFL